jgi:hypothetical protein
MPQSRLFMSSVSRRQLARRRPRGPRFPLSFLVALVLVVIAVLALVAGHGGF